MSQLVGDPRRFAVELELDTERLAHDMGRTWLFGRFRLWVADVAIGEWDNIAPLAPFLRDANRPQRTDEELSRIPPPELFGRLCAAIYRDDGRSDHQVHEDALRFGRFRATPPIESMDGWHCFVVDGTLGEVLVVGNATRGLLAHAILRHGEFDATLERAQQALMRDAAGG